MSTTGVVRAYRGADYLGTLLGQGSSPAIVANAWQHVEAKVVISDTVGTVEVRVEGVTVLDLSGLDTLNSADATVAQVALGSRIVSRSEERSVGKEWVRVGRSGG